MVVWPKLSSCKLFKSSFPILLGLFFLILRLGSVWFMAYKGVDPSPIQDPLEYKILADNLWHGHFSLYTQPPFEPQLLRTPGYPIFLALTLWLGSYGVIIFQQILVIIVGYYLYEMAFRYTTKTWAIILTVIFWVEPQSWMLSLQTMSETLFVWLGLSAIFLLFPLTLIESPHSISRKRVIVSAFFVVAALLTRPAAVLWLPWLVTLIYCYDLAARRRTLLNVLIFASIIIIGVIPWFARNYYYSSKVMLSSSSLYNTIVGFGNQSEVNLIMSGDKTIADRKNRQGTLLRYFDARAVPELVSVAKNVRERVGFNFYKDQLMCSQKVWFDRDYPTILEMVGFKGNQFLNRTADIADLLLSWGLLFLTVFGLWYSWKLRWYAIIALGGVILSTTFINVCVAYTRMFVSIFPLVLIIAGVGIIFIKDLFKKVCHC